jgi:serine/threonine protein kinase
MPRIYEVCESDNCLIVIEEYIEGRTLDEILDNGLVPKEEALSIIKKLCTIVNTLHTLPNPIIHRDIKPTNVIISDSNEVILLDMNVAKWYDPEESDDTRYLGTKNFAAPEQVGYGLSASSTKSDIYAIGILLNIMLTGKFPKEARPGGELWNMIERCISLDAKDRYDADELIIELDKHIRNI